MCIISLDLVNPNKFWICVPQPGYSKNNKKSLFPSAPKALKCTGFVFLVVSHSLVSQKKNGFISLSLDVGVWFPLLQGTKLYRNIISLGLVNLYKYICVHHFLLPRPKQMLDLASLSLVSEEKYCGSFPSASKASKCTGSFPLLLWT